MLSLLYNKWISKKKNLIFPINGAASKLNYLLEFQEFDWNYRSIYLQRGRDYTKNSRLILLIGNNEIGLG